MVRILYVFSLLFVVNVVNAAQPVQYVLPENIEAYVPRIAGNLHIAQNINFDTEDKNRLQILGRRKIEDKGIRVLATIAVPIIVAPLPNNQFAPDQGFGYEQNLGAQVRPLGPQSLSLFGNEISAWGIRALVKFQWFGNLTSLNLGNNRIGDEGIRSLVKQSEIQSEIFRNLTTLNLSENGITDEGVWILSEFGVFINLQTLILSNRPPIQNPNGGLQPIYPNPPNMIGNNGAWALSNSQNLRKLMVLNLSGNQIDREMAETLAGSPSLPELTNLDVRRHGSGQPDVVIREIQGRRLTIVFNDSVRYAAPQQQPQQPAANPFNNLSW